MKKFLSLILALAMVACMSVTAFAADGTTVLTVEVPDNVPSYTLNVPATVNLQYDITTEQDIGTISISNVQNVPNGHRLWCRMNATDLVNTNDNSDTIAVKYAYERQGSMKHENLPAGTLGAVDLYTFALSDPSNPYTRDLDMWATISDWTGATPGATYQATITYVVYMDD